MKLCLFMTWPFAVSGLVAVAPWTARALQVGWNHEKACLEWKTQQCERSSLCQATVRRAEGLDRCSDEPSFRGQLLQEAQWRLLSCGRCTRWHPPARGGTQTSRLPLPALLLILRLGLFWRSTCPPCAWRVIPRYPLSFVNVAPARFHWQGGSESVTITSPWNASPRTSCGCAKEFSWSVQRRAETREHIAACLHVERHLKWKLSVTREVDGRLRWEDDWRGWFSVQQHVIKAEQPHEGTQLDQPCVQRACVSAFHPATVNVHVDAVERHLKWMLSVTRKVYGCLRWEGDGYVSHHDDQKQRTPSWMHLDHHVASEICFQPLHPVRPWLNRVTSEIAFQPSFQTPALVAFPFFLSAWCHCGTCHVIFCVLDHCTNFVSLYPFWKKNKKTTYWERGRERKKTIHWKRERERKNNNNLLEGVFFLKKPTEKRRREKTYWKRRREKPYWRRRENKPTEKSRENKPTERKENLMKKRDRKNLLKRKERKNYWKGRRKTSEKEWEGEEKNPAEKRWIEREKSLLKEMVREEKTWWKRWRERRKNPLKKMEREDEKHWKRWREKKYWKKG